MGLLDKLKSVSAKTSRFFSDDDEDTNEDESLSTQKTTYETSSLNAPPPPAVPGKRESMSVMIAVNGETYGPYERVTLLEMISTGALTLDTLVFKDGMSEWKQARYVQEVNVLFGSKAAPSVPPIPWAPAPQATYRAFAFDVPADEPTTNGNGLSAKLNSLIAAAVADGEISDLERQVLIRNAQEENVPMDEFVIVLEAKLYEQRQKIKAEQEQREQQAIAAKAQAQAAVIAATAMSADNNSNKAPAQANGPRKCPACGALISGSMITQCPECGYELDMQHTQSPVQSLVDKLQEMDHEYQQMSPVKQAFSGAAMYQRKVTAINTFIVPNTKRAILDFLMVACSSANACQMGDPTKKAWKQKAKEVVERAKMMFTDDNEFQVSLRATAKSFGIKVK